MAKSLYCLNFGQVLIPQAVQQELADERSPAIVQAWISQPSEWLVIQTVNPSDSDLDNLDPGERAAIVAVATGAN